MRVVFAFSGNLFSRTKEKVGFPGNLYSATIKIQFSPEFFFFFFVNDKFLGASLDLL